MVYGVPRAIAGAQIRASSVARVALRELTHVLHEYVRERELRKTVSTRNHC